MAKYDRKAAQKISQVMREFKDGELTVTSDGRPVTSRKQAVAVALAEARAAGSHLPPPRRRSGA